MYPPPRVFINVTCRRRLRLLDGRPEPRAAVDMGQQRPARGAQGLDAARGPDHRGRPVPAPQPERRDQGVRVHGGRVQQPAPVRVQARGERDGQGADQDPQGAQGRRRRRRPAAEDGDRRVVVVVAAAARHRVGIL